MAAVHTTVTVSVGVKAAPDRVWKCWTTPEDIVGWNNASADWHTPRAVNDLRPGGKFVYRMEARDGSVGFDFEGTYETIKAHERIVYRIADGRKVEIRFARKGNATIITETFEVETYHPVEHQRTGWQAILQNFKNYAEAQQ